MLKYRVRKILSGEAETDYRKVMEELETFEIRQQEVRRRRREEIWKLLRAEMV
jgi:hypothetical protein